MKRGLMMMYVNDLMTSNVFTLKPTDTLRDVRMLMNLAKIRHIPVTDSENIFLGLVTHRDLLAFTISKLADIDLEEQHSLEVSITIGDIMQTEVATTAPTMTLRETADVLYRNKYGCLPVLENGILVGIITEADFLRLAIALLCDPT